MKNSNYTIGNRTLDPPACSAVSQPTTLPRTLHIDKYLSTNFSSAQNFQTYCHLSINLHICIHAYSYSSCCLVTVSNGLLSISCYSILIPIVTQYFTYFRPKWFLDPCSTTVSQFAKTLQRSPVLFYETKYSYSALKESECSEPFFILLYTLCFAVRAFITRLGSSY